MRTTLVHSSGRFDRPISALARSVDRLRLSRGVSVLTHTEMNRKDTAGAFRNRGWSYVHAQGGEGQAECVAEWDNTVWQLGGDIRTPKLSNRTWFRAKAYGGKQAAPVRALVVNLASTAHPKQDRLTAIVAHMPLDNTPTRADIWVDCCRGLRGLVKAERRRDPDAKVVILADWNKNFRLDHERALIDKHVARPLKMAQGWAGNVPAVGGTHGKQLIDGAVTDLSVLDCFLLPDDNSSDHRPFGVTVEL